MRSRSIAVPLLAALCALGCRADTEAAPSSAGAEGSMATPAAAVPKAADPATVKILSLDLGASKFDFEAAKITRTHHGSFKQFSGSATLVGGALQAVTVEVETTSIEADDPKLAAHLQSADFLDVQKFPKSTFKSSSIVEKPSGAHTHEIAGALTLHGITENVTFPATVSVTPASVSGSAVLRIDRKKFGVVYPGLPDDLIKDEVVLKPSFVFTRK
jgi:polyisoprenoid-binding protein YceI